MIQALYLNKAAIFLKCLSSRDLTGMISHPDLHGIEGVLRTQNFQDKNRKSWADRHVFVTVTQSRNV